MKFENNYLTSIFLFACFFAGCKVKQPVTSEKISFECQKSFTFIKNEIIENEGSWYEFKDMENLYEEYDKGNFNFPFNPCLVGKNKAFLRNLLGEPHREAISKRDSINTLVYCFSKSCIEEKSFGGMGGVGLIFFFDENELVKDFYTQIGLVEHYKTLDR